MNPNTDKTELRIAALQMNSGADVAANIAAIEAGVTQAAASGVRLLLLPENALFMGAKERDKLAVAEDFKAGPCQQRMADLAREHRIFLVCGAFPLKLADEPERVTQSLLVYGPDGELRLRYDKLHLFDVVLADGSEYKESRLFRAGQAQPGCFDCDGVQVGVSICYDLRFPELYRELAAQGAEILLVPAAFTWPTGQAHWEVLLRARAIENLTCVVAANQCGLHPNERSSWGHSMMVGPWGEILAEAEDSPGLIVANFDRAALVQRRREFPVLEHRRLTCGSAQA